jgi:hypothetical protein
MCSTMPMIEPLPALSTPPRHAPRASWIHNRIMIKACTRGSRLRAADIKARLLLVAASLAAAALTGCGSGLPSESTPHSTGESSSTSFEALSTSSPAAVSRRRYRLRHDIGQRRDTDRRTPSNHRLGRQERAKVVDYPDTPPVIMYDAA